MRISKVNERGLDRRPVPVAACFFLLAGIWQGLHSHVLKLHHLRIPWPLGYQSWGTMRMGSLSLPGYHDCKLDNESGRIVI